MPFSPKLKAWIELQELPKHTATLLPFALGVVLVWYATGLFNWGIFITALIAVFFITNGTYISNEYFDYEADRTNTGRVGGEKQSVTSTGGTRVLAKGLIKKEHALIASVIFFLLAIPLGIVLQFYFKTGPWTIPLGAMGILVGWFYTAPPVKAAYRGWGELFMAIGFGTIPFMGYYIFAGFSWLAVIVALPWAVCTPALKILREFPDYESDTAVGKHNLVVRFGREKMALIYILMIIAVLLLLIPVFLAVKSWWFVLIALPVILLLRSLIPMAKGLWRDKKALDSICANGFLGLLSLPLVMLAIFVIVTIVS